MRWSRARIWKWKSAFCRPAVPPFCTHWPPGGRSAPRPNGRLPSVHSSISPAIWPDSSAGASRAASSLRTRADLPCRAASSLRTRADLPCRAASSLRTRADLPCHEHDAACCAACGVGLLQDRSEDSWRAELHSILADRAFSSGLPRRRVLAIGPDKGRRLAPQARCDRAISERLSAATDRSDGCRLRIRVQRTSLSNLAGPRAGDAICRIGAAIDDRGHRDFRLSRRLADSWSVGHVFPIAAGAGAGRIVARPFDRAPFCARFIARNKIVYAWDIRQRLRAHCGGYRPTPAADKQFETNQFSPAP